MRTSLLASLLLSLATGPLFADPAATTNPHILTLRHVDTLVGYSQP